MNYSINLWISYICHYYIRLSSEHIIYGVVKSNLRGERSQSLKFIQQTDFVLSAHESEFFIRTNELENDYFDEKNAAELKQLMKLCIDWVCWCYDF